MSYVTVIQSTQPTILGKRFELDSEGKLKKSAISNVTEGKATSFALATPEDLKLVISRACEARNWALMPGKFINSIENKKAQLVTEGVRRHIKWDIRSA